MATTTASVSISSSDLTPGSNLSINASSTLMKTGLTTGLEFVDMGKGTLTVAHNTKALFEGQASSANGDQACFVYLCNLATDDTYYIEVGIHDTIVGRLYAGDWMFVPYSQGDAVAELFIEAEGGTCNYEYAIFRSANVLVDSSKA